MANLSDTFLERESGNLRWLTLPAQAAQRERNLALIQAFDGRPAEALPALRRLASRAGARWWDKHNLGALLLVQGDYAGASRWLRRARAEGGADERVLYALTLAHLLAGDEAAAQETLSGAGKYTAAAQPSAGGKRLWLTARALSAGDLVAAGTTAAGEGLSFVFSRLVDRARAEGLSLDLAYLVPHTAVTGGARVIFEQANRLAASGHQVKVLSYGSRPEWFALTSQFQQVPSYRLLSEAARGADLMVGAFWSQLHDLIRATDATRVFFAQGDQFVWEPESVDANVRDLAEAAHKLAPVPLLTVSEAMAARVQEIYDRCADVVPNGIDLELFRPRSDKVRPNAASFHAGALRLLAMGRDTLPFKGVQDVFEAVTLLRERGLNCELTWVTPETPQTVPPDCRVVVSPKQEQLAELYASADVFVSGSRYESFSLPPLEAMASGTAVVAVANAGLLTYAEAGRNCLLTPAADPRALAEAVLHLAEDTSLRARLVRAGLETAGRYGWEVIIPDLEQRLIRYWLEDLFITGMPPAASQERISLCIIARDEAQTIGRCLESAKGAVDEMVVLDTGSQDDTRRIARSLGAKVYEAPWEGDFSRARNQALERASGEWIICLDADEALPPDDPDMLRRTLRAHPGADGLTFPVISFVDETDATVRVVQENLRLFRNRPRYRFEGAIHEQIAPAIHRAGGMIQRAPVTVLHYGYLPSVRRAKEKSDRNLSLLKLEVSRTPEDPIVHFNLANEYLAVADYGKARDGFLEAHRLASTADRDMTYFSRLLFNLTRSYITLGQEDEALAVIAEGTELYPDYTDLWLLQGQILATRRDDTGASAAFDRCLHLGEAKPGYFSVEGNGSWVPWYYKGCLWEAQGAVEQAVVAYGKGLAMQSGYREPAVRLAALAANPALPPALLGAVESALRGSTFGDELLAQGHYKARRFARAAEFAARVRPTAVMALAVSAGRLAAGDASGALSQLSGVTFEAEQAVEAAKLEIAAAWSQSRWEDAGQVCGRLAELDSGVGQAFLALNDALRGQGAAPSGRKTVSVPSQSTTDVMSTLEFIIDLGLYDVFERAATALLAQPSPSWRVALGKLFYRKGFSDLAFEVMVAVPSLDDLDIEALRILGEAALAKGLTAEAETFFRKAGGREGTPCA
ncbi:MAG: glycosyltransferase [Symbiobacteriia bacterium]